MKKTNAKNEAEKPKNETAFEGVASVCSLLAVWLFVLTFVFQNFAIPSSSMASTLLTGDHVLVERVSLSSAAKGVPFVKYGDVQRGEVIVFYKPPAEPSGEHIFLAKRVVGVPGDRIHLRRGIVYLNGVAQNEPQTAKPTYANYNAYRDDFPSVPPPENIGVTADGLSICRTTGTARTWWCH
jgi:signal peptidase I